MDIVELQPGGVIIDRKTGDIGLLVRRYDIVEHLPITLDLIADYDERLWAWEILWSGKGADKNNHCMRYDLQESLDSVILSVGDIIIDTFSGYTGMLVRREHRIDMMDDDMYFWEVKWMTNVAREDLKPNQTRIRLSDILEEEGMKLSIVVGAMEWHSINGGTFEL